jgi:hypothetical protein
MNKFIDIGNGKLINPTAIALVEPNGAGIKITLLNGKELISGLSIDNFRTALSKTQ